jgi:serine/threonine protein kinase
MEMSLKRALFCFLCLSHALTAEAGIITCIEKLFFPQRFKALPYKVENIPEAVIQKLDRKLHFLTNSSDSDISQKTFISQSGSYIIPLDKFLSENRTSKGNPRFIIEELLGAGGQGAVFHAFDHQEQREVAIKISEKHENGPAAINLSTNLENKLRDNNPLLTIFDYKVKDGWAITTSEWVPNKNYAHYSKSKAPYLTPVGALFFPFTPQTIIEHFTIMRNLARALREIHRNNFIYTDLKAENIAVFGDLQVKLLDLDSLSPLDEKGGVSIKTMPLITSGHESPEMQALWEYRNHTNSIKQNLAKKVGVKSDSYSFSIVLQEMINYFKKNNFKDDPLVEIAMEKLLNEVVYPLREVAPQHRMSMEEAEKKLNELIASIKKYQKNTPSNP